MGIWEYTHQRTVDAFRKEEKGEWLSNKNPALRKCLHLKYSHVLTKDNVRILLGTLFVSAKSSNNSGVH
jgi:hypothetical protein